MDIPLSWRHERNTKMNRYAYQQTVRMFCYNDVERFQKYVSGVPNLKRALSDPDLFSGENEGEERSTLLDADLLQAETVLQQKIQI